jgi:multiple sugar transport system ATP-binding protein
LALIEFRNVGKQYPDGHEAVKNLSLTVEDGELMVLVGPSGCGKTTALRMVAGLESITSGDLYIGDRLVNELAPKERDIAMVFQSYALYPHMTVRENVGFALKMGREDPQRIRTSVEGVSDLLDLKTHLDRRPSQLSGGQRQRVAMGRAIVREPSAFLMDEPLSNLDATLRVAMRAQLAQLQNSLGTTTIYVTHDQVEAMTLGHRVAVMRLGVLEQVDSPMQVYLNPANVFVATFIGSPAMNLFDGMVVDGFIETPVARIPLGDALLRRVAGELPRGIIVGVRPENITDTSPGEAATAVDVPVEMVEAVGSDSFVYFRNPSRLGRLDLELEDVGVVDQDAPAGPLQTLAVARVSPFAAFAAGQRAKLWIDLKRVHLFDVTSGEALTTSAV